MKTTTLVCLALVACLSGCGTGEEPTDVAGYPAQPTVTVTETADPKPRPAPEPTEVSVEEYLAVLDTAADAGRETLREHEAEITEAKRLIDEGHTLVEESDLFAEFQESR